MNKIITKLLLSLKNNLEERISFIRDFNEVYELKKKDLLTKKIDMLEESFSQDQLDLSLKNGIDNDLTRDFIDKKIKKIEEKYYWKKRSVKATLNRKKNKDKITADQLTDLFKAKLENLEKEKLAKIEGFKKKLFSPENLEKYEEQLSVLSLAKDQKKLKIEEQYQNSVTRKRDLSAKKINFFEALLTKVNKVIEKHMKNKDLEDYDLPEDCLLRVDGLTMRFGGLRAVDDLSFDVKAGEIFGLIGPNGAGKTTVFNCITKFYRPSEGQMYFRKNQLEAVRLNDYKVHQIIKHGIVRTFQNVELVWELNILDNLLVAAHSLYRTGFFGQLFHTRKLKREEMILRKKAEVTLERLGLLAYKDSYPLGLPYGILKKIELARTLMVNPKMIILDEPAAGLNDAETEDLAEIIKHIRDEENITIFLVEHDMGLVMDICDTVCAISFGKKLAIGTPKEIQENSSVREAYLGEQ